MYTLPLPKRSLPKHKGGWRTRDRIALTTVGYILKTLCPAEWLAIKNAHLAGKRPVDVIDEVCVKSGDPLFRTQYFRRHVILYKRRWYRRSDKRKWTTAFFDWCFRCRIKDDMTGIGLF